MAKPTRGFTLVETMLVVTILGTLTLIGYPRMRDGMVRANVRGARTTLINLLSKARTAATQTNRITLLKIQGNNAFVLARPRLMPGAAGSNADTLGPVQPLGDIYGVTVTATIDSVRFDPRGLGTGFGTGTDFLVSRNGKTETIRVDGLGRVTK
jgi:prepilin-type N-terminal cleavage/methylation domain-containing protein